MRSTSDGFRRPGRFCRCWAWPTVSWIASGPAARDGGDGLGDVLDAGEERVFVEEAVVDRNVEAALRARMKKPLEAIGSHGGQ